MPVTRAAGSLGSVAVPEAQPAWAYGYAAVALSGAAALAHELLWTRRLLDLLGSSVSATTRVLGAFFLGLCLGSVAAARVAPRLRRPLRALACAELSIALLCAPIVTLPAWTGGLWRALGVEGLASPWAGALRLALALLVVLPPAVAMGFTVPLAVAGLAIADGGRRSVRLYALNTLGGALGLVLVSLWSLEALGATGSLWLAITSNLLAAALALAADRASTPEPRARWSVGAEVYGASRRPPWSLLLLAALSGAGVLALEVVAMQSLMLVATMSYHAPAALLGSVVLVLAAGAYLVSLLGARVPWSRAAPLSLGLGGLLLSTGPLVYWELAQAGGWLNAASSVLGAAGRISGLTLLFVGPGLSCVGMLFPLLLMRPEARSSSGVAWLLACNGAGGFLGAELAHRWLLPALGPHVALGSIGVGYAAIGVVLAMPRGARSTHHWIKIPLAAAFACAAAVALTCGTLQDLPTLNTHMGFDLIEETRGHEGVLAVVEHPHTGRSLVLNNQYVLGSTSARFDQERQAHLALLLHPAPRRVGLLGLATGSTASAALLHPVVREVEVAELSGLVVDAAAAHFGHVNRQLARDPRVRILQEDGRTFVSAASQRFDVLVGDLFLPWSPGVGRLYSLEHFQAVKRALRPGGVFCQWLPMHQFTWEQLELVVNTLRQVFPTLHLFRNTFHVEAPALGLCASESGDAPWETLRTRIAQVQVQKRVRDPSLRHFTAVAMLYLGRIAGEPRGATHTLGNATLELDAGRTRIVHGVDAPYLRGQRWNDYLRHRVAELRKDETTPAELHAAAELGFLLTNWEIAQHLRDDRAPAIAATLRRGVPEELRFDRSADWKQWPGPEEWRADRTSPHAGAASQP